MKSHSIAPDGSPALHDHQRAAGDIGQRRERLGGGDGGGDGDGVDRIRNCQIHRTSIYLFIDLILNYFILSRNLALSLVW